MPTNHFLPFATGVGANVMTQAEWDALAARLSGFPGGIARSRELNKVWRQSSFMAAALAQMAGNLTGLDALDNGDLAAMETILRRSLRHAAAGIRSGYTAGTHTLTAAQMGFVWIGADGGNVTLNLPSAAAQDGHPMRVVLRRWDAATGNTVTVNAAAGQTIVGASSMTIRPGQTVMLLSDGISQWVVVGGSGRLLNVRTITATGTYTPTPGTLAVRVRVQGSGGGGGGAPATGSGQVSAGAPGSGGGISEGYFITGFAGVTVTIGAGGTGGTGATGNSGGTTSFGALVTVPGGAGGGVTAAAAPALLTTGGASAAGSGGNVFNRGGEAGQASVALGSLGTRTYGGAGGSSPFGTGGPAVFGGLPGSNATGHGAGGGGTANGEGSPAQKGGDGSPAIVIIEEIG